MKNSDIIKKNMRPAEEVLIRAAGRIEYCFNFIAIPASSLRLYS